MGAEPWSYYVPYKKNIGKAFLTLPQELFARGEYEKPYIDIGWLDELEFFDACDEEREYLYKNPGTLNICPLPAERSCYRCL
jgi:hypothetical protein